VKRVNGTPGGPLDRFFPEFDVRERHEVDVRAPAGVVFDVARSISLSSLPLVRAIFWLRARGMGARGGGLGRGPFVDEALAMGWGRLADEPGRLFAAGAVCQPWIADVVFRSVPAAEFASYSEPDRVKIAWTLEAEPLGPERARLASETRVAATDEASRRKFARYWRVVRIGIVTIRLLMLPAIRREAERRWRRRS
jgi:hypothetical protein